MIKEVFSDSNSMFSIFPASSSFMIDPSMLYPRFNIDRSPVIAFRSSIKSSHAFLSTASSMGRSGARSCGLATGFSSAVFSTLPMLERLNVVRWRPSCAGGIFTEGVGGMIGVLPTRTSVTFSISFSSLGGLTSSIFFLTLPSRQLLQECHYHWI